MNLYEINKQLMAQSELLDEAGIAEAKETIKKFCKDDSYYMLLCHELRYYTMFDKDSTHEGSEDIATEVIECLDYFADGIHSIELIEENGAIEIWVDVNEEIYVMYLFDYSGGVIHCV